MKRVYAAALAALGLSFTATQAHEFAKGGLQIDHPMAFETPRTAQSGAGYMTITNSGPGDDQLIAVQADFPKVMIHTTIENDGVARMVHVDAIDIPAGKTVAMQPGGMHVMFMGLNGDPLEVGETIPATLVFASAGEVPVVFHVEARGDGAVMDHSAHSATD